MEQFQTIPKKWGNSIGITIPREIIEQEGIKPKKEITVLVIGNSKRKPEEIFGSLKLKRDTQEVMDELDGGYDV